MAHSIPYQISQAMVAALRAELENDDIKVLDNPPDPSHLRDGAQIVFVEDRADAPIDRPGQAEGRSFTTAIGVITRTDTDRADADALMVRAKGIVEAAVLTLGRTLAAAREVTKLMTPREGQRTYRVEGLDVGGALIVTAFDTDYRTPAGR